MFKGSKINTFNYYRLILTVNIFCSLMNAGFPTMASNSNAFIVMRIHSWSRNINFFIKLLLSGNIDFSVMLSTNTKAINMILRRVTSCAWLAYVEVASHFICTRRWWIYRINNQKIKKWLTLSFSLEKWSLKSISDSKTACSFL